MQRCSSRRPIAVWCLSFFSVLLLACSGAVAGSTPVCPDADGDGYADCSGGCDDTGLTCGDCDDTEGGVNPGASELCNEIDEDCDGNDTNGFDVGANCQIGDPGGCSAGDAGGCCLTNSVKECTPDGLGTQCAIPVTGINEHETEGPGGNASCFDATDNDCDGLIDHAQASCQTAELCNGFDDDGDGTVDEDFANLGDACSAGVGSCFASGQFVCTGDQTGTVCSAVAGDPRTESPSIGIRCSNGKDDDCDGATDLGDSDCQSTEVCDGIDNDGNDGVDEDFPTLGDACTSGLGQCQAAGTLVCKGDGSGVQCDAVAGIPTVEGPAGNTCIDTLDNDCDGVTDLGDPNCASSNLRVTCALPVIQQEVGQDCTSWHRFNYAVGGAAPGYKVSTELLALDSDGNVVNTYQNIQNNEVMHLRSRVSPTDWKFSKKKNTRRGTLAGPGFEYQVFVSIPLVHVKVDDGVRTAEAYCSSIPYLRVFEPNGDVAASDEDTNVLVAMPLIDPDTLEFLIDGVDIVAGLGLDPEADFPGGPYSGTVSIGGNNVEIKNLTVDAGTSPSPGVPATNTLTFAISNLGCGQHIYTVNGERIPGSLTDSPTASAQCYQDNGTDKSKASVFGIELTTPTDQLVTNVVPTPVQGRACHGEHIGALAANGKALSVAGQTFTAGDGVTTGDLYEVPIDTTLDPTDLKRDFDFGDVPAGTLDAGSNTLTLVGTDNNGNQASKSVIFAVGDVAKPDGIPTSFAGNPITAEAILSGGVRQRLNGVIDAIRQQTRDTATTSIENAFVVGLTPSAVQTLFTEKCTEAGATFESKIQSQLPIGKLVDERSMSGGCSCNPTVRTRIQSVDVVGTIACPVTFVDGKIQVSIDLPQVSVGLHAKGSCETTFLGACVAETIVDSKVGIDVQPFGVDFEITEEQLEGTATPAAPIIGVCKVGGAVCADNADCANLGLCSDNEAVVCDEDSDCGKRCVKCAVATSNGTGSITAEVNCLASICNWIADAFIFLTNAIFGTDIDPLLVSFSTDFEFNSEIGASDPDPIELGEIKVDEEEVANFDQKLKGTIDEVEINANGLTASLTGEFETLVVDPAVPANPGTPISIAPVPTLPVAGAEDAFLVLSDDALNMMFASMTAAGKLKASCADVGLTLGTLIPACEDILITKLDTVTANEDVTAFAQGICHAIRLDDCETIPTAAAPRLIGYEQGSCHGFKGDNCEQITLNGLFEKLTCQNTFDPNLDKDTSLLICSSAGMPATIKIEDDGGTAGVETKLRMNDLSMRILADRDANGLNSDPTLMPGCLVKGSPTAGDCNMFNLCLDVNFFTTMSFQTCTDGKPGIVTAVDEIQTTIRDLGHVCKSSQAGDDTTVVDGASTDSASLETISSNVDDFTPPVCSNGLNLGGLLQFVNPKLISVESNGNTEFQDYLGVTGDVQP